jgi:hypothetical protein
MEEKMKYKNKLLLFLALNAASTLVGAKTINYDKITKNITTGKSNNDSYKLIERLLAQKNKELKDLYAQGDYIIKPEYLEWQIFASGFYAERNNGDNTSGNSRYHSKTEGYFDENGRYVQETAGKPYKNKQEVKSIDLGISIPLKEINREGLQIEVNPNVTKPVISAPQGVAAINPLNVPVLDLFEFSPSSPNIIPLTPVAVTITLPSLNVYNHGQPDLVYGRDVNLPAGTYKTSDPLSLVSGDGIVDAIIDFSGATGVRSSDANSVMIVDIAGKKAVSIDGSRVDFMANGTIELNAINTAGIAMESDPNTSPKATNAGTINGNNNSQAALIFLNEQAVTTDSYALANAGNIVMNGNNSLGIAVNSANGGHLVTAVNNKNITMNGTGSYGLVIAAGSALKTGSSIENSSTGIITISDENSGGLVVLSGGVTAENAGKINLTSTSENSFGIYATSANTNTILNTGEINISGINSIGLRSEGGDLANNAGGSVNITGGSGNIGMYASSGKVTNRGDLIITGGTQNKGFFITGSGSIGESRSKVDINADESYGVVVTNGGYYGGSGTFSVSGEDSYGFVAKGGTINAGSSLTTNLTGEKSVGIYAGGSTTASSVILTGGTINVKDGGVNFGAGQNGTLSMNHMNFTVGSQSLGFFTEGNGDITILNSTGTIKGGTSSNDRGTVFSVKGSGISSTEVNSITDLSALLTSSGINPTNLTLTMESGSRLFSLAEASVKLSVISSINSSPISLPGVTINGSDYKTMLLHKGLLNIDEEVDLDDANSGYSRVEMANSTIINNNTIKGVSDSQLGMAQANGGGLPKSTVTLTNNGIINLTGQKSVGIYADYGIIDNNNIIDTQGSSSFGIFGVNGTEITTAAGSTVKAGDSGAGIVAQSYILDPITGLIVSGGYGDGTFKVDHNGEVVMTGANTFGIYADNNDTNPLTNIASRIVNLNSGSMINVSGTTSKGTAVYINKGTLNTSGDIKTGTEGIAIYAKDSNVNLNGGTIDLLGADSTGIFLDGTSNITATGGTINVKGNNTTVFLINSAATFSGLDNISVNVDPNLKITLANVKNNNFTYNGTLNGAGKDSVIIAGDNSAIEFGTSAVINSTAENVAGLFTKGGSAVNKGMLSLTGSNSIGVYAENANLSNEGTLILGTNGVGLYNENGVVSNITGKIETGSNGVGIFGLNSVNINNNTLISSTGNSVIGIFADGNTAGTVIKNDVLGIIDLSGENSIGIYTAGTSAKDITNDGTVIIGNSSDANNPSIGIYNNILGTTIQNNGTLTLGTNSLGIFDKGGSVTENGTLNIGSMGTGILSENGTVNITGASVMNIGGTEAIGVYAKNNASITNASSNMTIGNGSYGFVLETGSNLTNTGSVTLGDKSVFVYGNGAGTITSSNAAAITVTGAENMVYYTVNGGIIRNDSTITADAGVGNIAIYNRAGSVENNGNISLGDSLLIENSGIIDPNLSKYSVGIYAEESTVLNRGDISLGSGAVGIYVKDNSVMAVNHGNITSGTSAAPKSGAIGIFAEGGVGIENFGNITLYGDNSIGIAGKNAGNIINRGIITVAGKDSIGIYGTLNTTIENIGTINISGTDSAGIVAPEGKIINKGTIYYSDGASATKEQDFYPLPELVNMGLIEVNGHFSNEGMDISLKPDLNTLAPSTQPDVDFVLSSGVISANSMTITDTVKILPDFSQGTNANIYKLENVFMTNTGQIISSNGKIPVVSKSLTWEATPRVNADGNVDIYMHKLAYEDFTDGLWYEDFGKALDEKYAGSTGEAGSIFDKIDLIEEERDFRHVMASLAGNVYANMNQRTDDIARAFDSSLMLMENSKNNTKENVKVNVIAGKGRTSEDTDGVVGYDYTTTGILALREVERTYRHTFGYSLGYLHTGFEFKDGNDSEEWVDTIQLGLHNKYDVNNWILKNNIIGRISLHNIDRNIDWPSPTGRSEMNGTYETYSLSSDNTFGRELALGKHSSLTPYGGVKATYITRPSFSESGLESLEVEGNDAWSVKPRVGIELKGAVPLGANTAWQLKGTLDMAYEYELANLNERERARLTKIEDNYHNLSKPEKEKGTFKTRAAFGVEVEDRYGIFLTGEYGLGNSDKDEYRAGVTLKAVF